MTIYHEVNPYGFGKYVRFIISKIENGIILCNGIKINVDDERYISASGWEGVLNFKIYDNGILVTGYHDSPDEMYITDDYKWLISDLKNSNIIK